MQTLDGNPINSPITVNIPYIQGTIQVGAPTVVVPVAFVPGAALTRGSKLFDIACLAPYIQQQYVTVTHEQPGGICTTRNQKEAGVYACDECC